MSTETVTESRQSRLSRQGYWPAWAAESFAQGKFADVVQLCRERLVDDPRMISGRVLYAKALVEVGQYEQALEQGYAVLTLDPDNLQALKLLGDIADHAHDQFTAYSHYERVLELDPECHGLCCPVAPKAVERTHTITLTRPEENPPHDSLPLRTIPFYTETMGDLYLAQGYPRLAATVYKVLHERSRHPRFLEKLARAEDKARAKP
ncbi:MAG: hypothetical protein IPH75_00680 [bacterium]|nr:hypothetical protein [bacterium]